MGTDCRVPGPAAIAARLPAWYGGTGPALVAAFLGGACADYFLIPPRGTLVFHDELEYVGLALYAGVGIGIALIGGVMHAAPARNILRLHQMHDALAQTGVGVWTWNIPENTVEANQRCLELFGFPPRQSRRTSDEFLALLHAEDLPRVQQATADAIEHGAEFNTEYRVVSPAGAVRSLATRGKAIFAGAGRAHQLVGVCWDVLSSDAAVLCPCLIVESEGRTIPDSALPKFFNLFSIAEAIVPGGDLGLGPPMAQRILSLFGASCSVMNPKPHGIRFRIMLKNAPHAVLPALPHENISAPAELMGEL